MPEASLSGSRSDDSTPLDSEGGYRFFRPLILLLLLLMVLMASLYFGYSRTGNETASSDCTYVMSDGEVEFPLQLEADVELLDGDTMLVRSPKGCPDKFKYTVEIGDFHKPVTKVYTQSGETHTEGAEFLEKGYPNVTAYYVGDKESFKAGDPDVKVVDRGKLPELYGSDKEYSSKNALVTFYRRDQVFFNGDKIYAVQVFFNEK